jgi:hypothetical protein
MLQTFRHFESSFFEKMGAEKVHVVHVVHGMEVQTFTVIYGP